MLTPREKSPLPEEDRTRDAASSRTASPTHYQRAIPASEKTVKNLELRCCDDDDNDGDHGDDDDGNDDNNDHHHYHYHHQSSSFPYCSSPSTAKKQIFKIIQPLPSSSTST